MIRHIQINHNESYTTKVYNLFVYGEHEYFANGVLVHNCPVCEAFDYEGRMSGERVDYEFTGKDWSVKPLTLNAETHTDHDYNGNPLESKCRCHITWTNFPDPIIDKLVNEMEASMS